MSVRALCRLFLLALVMFQAGCATGDRPLYDTTSDLEPAPSRDDSHGWGTGLQAGGH